MGWQKFNQYIHGFDVTFSEKVNKELSENACCYHLSDVHLLSYGHLFTQSCEVQQQMDDLIFKRNQLCDERLNYKKKAI